MRVAIVGSRDLRIQNLEAYVPKGVTEIVSGGARGIDTCARQYALRAHIKLTEFLPDYARYGRVAPLKRNITIIENADLVMAFWDGKSRGTQFVVRECRQRGIPLRLFLVTERPAQP